MRILVVLILVACTSSPNYAVHYSPFTGASHATKPMVMQHAMVAVTDAGKDVESSDASTGILMTKWFQGDGFAQENARYRIRIIVADDSTFTVDALCEGRSPLTREWETCNDTSSRPQFLVQLVKKIGEKMSAD